MSKKGSSESSGQSPKKFSRRTCRMLVILAGVAVLAALGCVLFFSLSGTGEPAAYTPSQPNQTASSQQETQPVNPEGATQAQTPTTEEPSLPQEPTESAPPETTAPLETTPPEILSTVPPVLPPASTAIELPYTIPGTELVILKVADYSGIYLEDGSDGNVSGIAVALLCNTGDEAIEYVDVTMVYEDKTLVFKASAIPAGARIAVQEMNKVSCSDGALLECSASIAALETLDLAEDALKLEDNGDNSITITNLTNEEIVTVRVFYKYYLEDEATFIGGITYTAKISNLKPQESIVVTPSHYTSEGSVVVMVRTYDTDA